MQKNSRYKTATAYAQAWLDAAMDSKDEKNIFAEVKAIQKSLINDKALWEMMAVCPDKCDVQSQAVEEIADAIGLSDVSKNTLMLIATNRRLNILKQITEDFIHLYYQRTGVIEVIVDTAVELSPAQDKKLRKVLHNKLNADIELKYRLKPEVLGGLAVKFNSFLIDDTLAYKLKKIEDLITGKQNALEKN